MGRLQRLGLQQRIILYVAMGLAIMFGGFGLFSSRAIGQATQLVYQERLSIASTAAGILERDFLHAVRDAQEATPVLMDSDRAQLGVTVRTLLNHLSKTDPFPFFRVTGVAVLSDEGRLLAESGRPSSLPDREAAAISSAALGRPRESLVVLPAIDGDAEGTPFVTLATSVSGSPGSPVLTIVIHAVSVNSTGPYIPGLYGQPTTQEAVLLPGHNSDETKYHLEVVNPAGMAVLGIGEDETPGTPSRHFPVIQDLMAGGKAGALLHEPRHDETFSPHVMAVVPLGLSGFYIVLEQPVDVALVLPLQLQQNFLLLAGLGFPAALLVAWVTTRRIVRPAQQLTAAAHRMAQGDLESPVNVWAEDEVAGLAESLDTMRRQLRTAYQQLENANRQLEGQVQERTARLGEVLKKIISAQEEERSRLARELHDETAQVLGALSISLDRARDSINGGQPDAAEYISEARAIAVRVLEETRRLILDLRPMALDDLGLAPAIRWYAETHLEEQGVAVVVEGDPPAARLPKHIEVSLFRVIQEAVNNIAKHANARHAQLRLAFRDSMARIVVTDDGCGFDVERVLGPAASGRSVGLLGMQERVRLLNGKIQIQSQEGKGTEIAIEIPLAEESR